MPIEFAPPPPATQGYQITPVQYSDPLQTLAQMGQLRTQGLQQQEAQMQLQQQQLKMQSQKAMVGAFAQGGTPDQIYQRAIASGQVLPEDAIAFQQHQMKYQTDAQALDEKKRQALSEDIGNYVGAASQATDQASLDAANAAAAKRGLFDSKKFDPIAQYPGDNTHFQAQLNGLLSHKQILDSAKTVADTGEATAKTGEATATAGKATADTAKTQLESQQLKSQLDFMEGLTPKTLGDLVGASIDKTKYPDLYARAYNDASNARAMRKPELMQAAIDKYATIASEQEKTISTETNPQVRQARTDQAVATARATAPIKIEVATGLANAMLGATPGGGGPGNNLHGEEYLSTLNNPALAAKVRAITRGDDDLPTGRAGASGAGALLANAVYQYDPTFTRLLGQKRKTELQDFSKTSPGSAGGNVVALNTMIHHGDLYQETADALQNGNFKPGNAAWNAVKDAFGKAPPTQANLVAQFLAGETAKVAGENTGGAVNEILANLKNANSPDQIRGAGRTLIGIAAGRMVPYKERIADAKLENLAPPLLGPSAREILIRRGFDPETMKPVAGGGGPPLIKTKADYDKLPSGTIYTESNGKTYRKP